ncbi:hypothetical protein [Microbacterium aerolatum]|uniref:hypothetical protein n=1 Tax=Microbacterium aerolatum TaxID=153731 RepID=UPI00384CD2BB
MFALAALTGTAAASASDPGSGDAQPLEQSSDSATFTYASVLNSVTTDSNLRTTAESDAQAMDLHVVNAGDEWAVADTSLLKSAEVGATYAITSDAVDLSWAPVSEAEGYKIVLDNQFDYFTTDTSLRLGIPDEPSSDYNVQILPYAAEGQELSSDAPFYGLHIRLPEASKIDSEDAAEASVASVAARLAGPYTTTKLVWRSFIPYARIDAPIAGCDYGSGYEFDGNNRGYGTYFGQWDSKTKIDATVSWTSANNYFYDDGFVSPSTVYNKSTGATVETRTVSGATLEANLLAGDSSSADIRFSLQAAIPYCIWNSIEGAFTITVTRTGNYAILSGEHRQMPNHEVIILSTTSDATSVEYTEAVVYQRDLSNPLCLVSVLCEKASMAGYAGTY